MGIADKLNLMGFWAHLDNIILGWNCRTFKVCEILVTATQHCKSVLLLAQSLSVKEKHAMLTKIIFYVGL